MYYDERPAAHGGAAPRRRAKNAGNGKAGGKNAVRPAVRGGGTAACSTWLPWA